MRLLSVLLLLLFNTQISFAESVVPIQTLILEAQGESMVGMQAVAEVVRNRALKARRTPEEVCLAKYQFSCWNDRKQAKNALSRVSPETWQRASKAWAESENSNLTRHATHYANLSLCSPAWARKMKKTVKIGHHTYFKEV